MHWLGNLQSKLAAKAAHAFLLHLNVADVVLRGQQLESLAEHLVAQKPLGDATFIAFFNRGTGIQFPDAEMERQFLKFFE
ncbi:MAG: hypothetical protein Q8Q41_04445, partial [bacterium]|nr:hypothetical protein [bacterium]